MGQSTNKIMNRIQKDLLKACVNKKVHPEYANVQGYASQFYKYDDMTMREIDEVVSKLKSNA